MQPTEEVEFLPQRTESGQMNSIIFETGEDLICNSDVPDLLGR